MSTLDSSSFGQLLRLIGFDTSSVPDDVTHWEFVWLNMPSSWGVFVLIALLLAIGGLVWFLYLREIDTCPRGIKILLAGIRATVLLVLVTISLGPALIVKQERRREPYVVVLRDASQSMNTKDEYPVDATAEIVGTATGRSLGQLRAEEPSRVQLVNQLVRQDDYQLIRALQQRGKVRVIDFADQLTPIVNLPAIADGTLDTSNSASSPSSDSSSDPSGTGPPLVPPLDATGRATNIWLAIKEALSLNPLAAIVLFSDGQHTAGDRPVEIAQVARRKGVGIFVVGVGDASRTMNLAVRNVYVRPKVWPNEPFEIDAVLVADGTEGQECSLQLLEHKVPAGGGQPGPGKTVDQTRLQIPADGGRLRVTFDRAVAAPGKYVYTVVADQLEGERHADDNRRTSTEVEAVNQEAKVLLIAGAPTWEYRMVQRLLRRDETLQVSCWLQTLDADRQQDASNAELRLTELPMTRQQLAKYHVIMLFDPNPDEFDEAWIELLKEFAASQSGGVMYMAGPKYSGIFLGNQDRTGPIRDLLPVRFGDVKLTEVQSLLSTNRRAWPLQITMENMDHPVMSFYQDPQRNLQRWENLPGIYWSFPAIGAKPTANVLLEHSDPVLRRVEGSRPLLVAGRYGSANTLYIGFNGSWRWRRVGRQAEFFDKFWLQAIRFLIETRTLQGQRRGFVEPERELYEVGDKIVLTANLKTASYEPLELASVEATLRNGEGQPSGITLERVPNQPGQYEATMIARQAGDYALALELPNSEGGAAMSISTGFRVQMPSIETSQVWLNEPLLRETAAASGGQYYHIGQLDRLANDIPDATEVIEVAGKPLLLWSEDQVPYRIFALLALLLTFEWAVRKGFRLL